MNTKHHIGLLIMRVSIAFTMLIYGISKWINGIDYIRLILNKYDLPSFFAYGIFIGEILMPILIIVGFRTKLVGLAFAIFCTTAIIMDRLPDLFSLNEFGGWSIDLIFIYLTFGIAQYFIGAGKYAVSTKNKWD